MTDIPIKAERTKEEMLEQMVKEAKRVERRMGAKSCVVICFFEGAQEPGIKNVTVQDAGKFPMPPVEFYKLMVHAHEQGLMDLKPKSKIIQLH